MSAVFLDTVGLLALWDASDQWHAAAEATFANLGREKASLTTTSFVLLECANAAARRPYRQAVERLRGRMESNNIAGVSHGRRLASGVDSLSPRRLGPPRHCRSRILCRDAPARHHESFHQRPPFPGSGV